jgi:hypothetical protein
VLRSAHPPLSESVGPPPARDTGNDSPGCTLRLAAGASAGAAPAAGACVDITSRDGLPHQHAWPRPGQPLPGLKRNVQIVIWSVALVEGTVAISVTILVTIPSYCSNTFNNIGNSTMLGTKQIVNNTLQ